MEFLRRPWADNGAGNMLRNMPEGRMLVSARLKPCPYCGAPAAARQWIKGYILGKRVKIWDVFCTNGSRCGVTMSHVRKRDVVRRWNARWEDQ